ncbi:MAG: hypothetical protein JWN76_1218 [Chitinophagaceae bacterium]|nr:hypothetical protein [Chitinophagaceae bacterium]
MVISSPTILQFSFADDGIFPNNPMLPLLIYQQVFKDAEPGKIENCVKKNKWKHAWRNGIYPYHHYHSTAHEVLVVYKGHCKLMTGGEAGEITEVRQGDVIVLPAGVAHCNKGCSEDFACIGAYPDGQDFDINYGKKEERPGTDINIQKLALPSHDPIFGIDGPLKRYWRLIEYDGI